MVYEIAVLKINPEKSADFEKMYTEVVAILRRQKGYKGDQLLHAIERPDEYVLKVAWEGVAAHQDFIDSPDYPQISGPFGDYVIESGFAHFTVAAES
jgi:heme-degrading monooxygenase HmoA